MQRKSRKSRKIAPKDDINNGIIALSCESPMGWTNLIFIQAIVGCAHALPDNKYCKGIITEMSQITKIKRKGCDTGKNYTQPWADFVQAVLDGKIRDPICENLLRGASIRPIVGNNQFDFILSIKAVEKAYESMDKISMRYLKVISNNKDHYDDGNHHNDNHGYDVEQPKKKQKHTAK